MNSLKAKLEAFQRSKVGLFLKKVMDDQAPNLAALLAWGTLSTLLPLMLGMLTVAGLVLRDPERVDEIYRTIQVLVPSQAQSTVGEALDSVRKTAGAPAGILAILLLLFNGSSFFANMASVFDQIYHVESRNMLMQRLVSLIMLVLVTALLVVSTLALGLGAVIDNLPLGQAIGPVVARVISWSLSILSAIVLFVLLYKVLPHAQQGWRDVLPGALLATVLFFVILTVFPLYVALFPPNQAYAVFGVFLVFTFWLYLLGFVFVLGAELNAFLQEPARSAALAEATQNAARGRADFNQQTGQVVAQASGDAPSMRGGGPLGAPSRSANAQLHQQGDAPTGAGAAPVAPASPPAQRPSLAGRILGFIGLLFAVIMLRKRSTTA
jgi:membrane protein